MALLPLAGQPSRYITAVITAVGTTTVVAVLTITALIFLAVCIRVAFALCIPGIWYHRCDIIWDKHGNRTKSRLSRKKKNGRFMFSNDFGGLFGYGRRVCPRSRQLVARDPRTTEPAALVPASTEAKPLHPRTEHAPAQPVTYRVPPPSTTAAGGGSHPRRRSTASSISS